MLNSSEWIDAIIKRLFSAEDRRLDGVVEELNRKNSALKGKQLFGFMHMGQRYVPSCYKAQQIALARSRQPLPTLSFELQAEARNLVSDFNKIDLDKSQIQQLLFKLLYQANTLQQIRDALPECLSPLVPEVSKLRRQTDDPTWFIRNDARALKQYKKLLPKIEMYAMSRMIY